MMYLKMLYLVEQAPNQKDSMIFSVGLVIICLLVLMLLWLPDILKGE